ncbi:SAV_915 family protein [Schaalia suimastitidis]|uniref:SAV_915 family protein n=1 Tax=Schaalia suimastitidis TaxID=121163 RepID=UPI0003FD3AE5|nr:SAV_915 family protein [Schaalia suimastitidis]
MGDGAAAPVGIDGEVMIPPVVYLPSTGASTKYGAEVELRTTQDGRTALLAYTALDRLSRCCGPHQPWVLYPTDRLGELMEACPFDVIYFDMVIPPEAQRPYVGGEQQ